MAGAGYKLFNTGDVLTAAQVNTYLMQQSVMVFANSTARTTALSGVLAEGMLSYLVDTNAVEKYDGSSWSAIGTGDIEGVTAGVGISGGGTSGTVTITNSMATAITTAGDLIKGTGAGTFDRLGIGSAGQVLTVSSGAPAWVTPGGATKNYSQIASTSLSGGSTQVTGLSTYDDIWIFIANASGTTATPTSFFRVNGLSTSIYSSFGQYGYNNTSPYTYKMNPWADASPNDKIWAAGTTTAADTISGYIHLFGCASTGKKMFTLSFGVTSGQYSEYWNTGGFIDTTTSVSSIEFALNAGTFDSGTIKVMAAV